MSILINIEKRLGEEWYEILKDEFHKPYMSELNNFITTQRNKTEVFPAENDIFNAYKLTPYSKVRVCIIAKDPYINKNEAHGIAFSTLNGTYTPSLKQIEKAVIFDIYQNGLNYIWNNNLTRWTEQGVMLLNKVLTVDSGKSGSHEGKGWEQFTLKTIEALDNKGIIFLLWGRDAQSFIPYIKNSVVLNCEHPVAASYQARTWNNKNCFTKVNELLTDKIKW